MCFFAIFWKCSFQFMAKVKNYERPFKTQICAAQLNFWWRSHLINPLTAPRGDVIATVETTWPRSLTINPHWPRLLHSNAQCEKCKEQNNILDVYTHTYIIKPLMGLQELCLWVRLWMVPPLDMEISSEPIELVIVFQRGTMRPVVYIAVFRHSWLIKGNIMKVRLD